MAMGSKVPVFQIVGYKNSGKTSLLSELIAYGTDEGDRIAAIKHHGHNEPLKVMHRDTDSFRLHESGAFMTGVDCSGRFQLELNHKPDFPLSRFIDLYGYFEPDLIVIEGFKQEPYPKAIVIKREEDLSLLNLSNIQFVITWNEKWTEDLTLPVYRLSDWRQSLPIVYPLTKRGEED
ncbi:molybdopterin-guanine dinucleotide biosynthesis protein B [Halobacillus salinarum]|uniref:Molybdopterin-guanine dinucleotide biosynthesis protein B n=1 Tax=Halobacillus salinarum TaxID=2932257 RepID=A0ABY4EG44_9BACI|nr:molybdopterin-guanine dinucleotide biosynthesis protein B [Halobacillus salinarum]UOQ43450.1 molybdopterin-guanine dinucleotide biosynthesis protein B [Halobacillus salinarum]